MQGDEEALQELHMYDIRASIPKTLHLDKATLQREFTATETMAVAARKCGMLARNYLVLSHSYLRLVEVFVQYVLFGFCR